MNIPTTQGPLSAGKLTDRDHVNMDAFLGHVLDAFQDGTITKDEAVSALAHVIAAIDIGNHGEAQKWFEQGRKFIGEHVSMRN